LPWRPMWFSTRGSVSSSGYGSTGTARWSVIVMPCTVSLLGSKILARDKLATEHFCLRSGEWLLPGGLAFLSSTFQKPLSPTIQPSDALVLPLHPLAFCSFVGERHGCSSPWVVLDPRLQQNAPHELGPVSTDRAAPVRHGGRHPPVDPGGCGSPVLLRRSLRLRLQGPRRGRSAATALPCSPISGAP
jgi:hypothetical protein